MIYFLNKKHIRFLKQTKWKKYRFYWSMLLFFELLWLFFLLRLYFLLLLILIHFIFEFLILFLTGHHSHKFKEILLVNINIIIFLIIILIGIYEILFRLRLVRVRIIKIVDRLLDLLYFILNIFKFWCRDVHVITCSAKRHIFVCLVMLSSLY